MTFQTIIKALKLGPEKKKVVQEPLADEAFDFLLFVLDSLQKRNLPCDGSFYASILFCGARLGGLRKKVASLLTEARATSDGRTWKMTVDGDGRSGESRHIAGWEDLIQNYDAYKGEIGNEMKLPPLAVRVGNRNIRGVLSAERAVTYNSVRPTRKPKLVGSNLT